MTTDSSTQHPYRTATCGELRREHIGTRARLAGWVHRVRDHGGIIFVDLRDHYGITQIVVNPDQPFYRASEKWRTESVVSFAGVIVERSEETANPKIATGEIELEADEMVVLGECQPVPFQVAVEDDCDENLRLRHRFLDLRRGTLHENVALRSRVVDSVRRRLQTLGFQEYQTPILTKSSPEGARDYLVPSRVHPGKFYALPQAPQLFKQLLMVAGFDRYFQIAPCFRDEDARADRSPGEFYQIDMEMSFVTQNDIFAVIEDLFTGLFGEFSKTPISPAPFQRIQYRDAMLKYGTDKPDLRIPIEMIDVTDCFQESDFNAFCQVVKRGGEVRGIPVRGAASQPRSFFDQMIQFTQTQGGKGLAYVVWTAEGPKSPILKFLDDACVAQLQKRGSMAEGDVMFFVADKPAKTARLAGAVRIQIADVLGLRKDDTFEFCWIVDYPMFEYNEDLGRTDFSHNPFSMPQGGMEALTTLQAEDVLAYQYDLVCNGMELSSGAIRNHRPDVMLKAFEIAGYSKAEVEEKFGGLLNALRFGAPPHGGIAPGLERVLMLLTGARNIREVTAFPMNQTAQDLLLGAPGTVSAQQLRELHIQCVLPKTKTKTETKTPDIQKPVIEGTD